MVVVACFGQRKAQIARRVKPHNKMTEYVTGSSFYYGELLTFIVRWPGTFNCWAHHIDCGSRDSS